MRQVIRVAAAWMMVAAFALSAAPLFAQGAQTPSQFYMEYRKAFDAAKKVEDLLPFMSTATKKQVEATPPAERPEIFEMIKMMGALTNVKISKETRTANGATLTVDALDSDKAKTTGTIDIVREGNAWKLGKESWKSGNQ
jgi:hypothetical protein